MDWRRDEKITPNLQSFELYLKGIGFYMDNDKYLGFGIKKLPKNLKHLVLDFSEVRITNLLFLGDSMK